MYLAECKMPRDDALQAYAEFLRDLPKFKAAMARVLAEWPVSCEHFLTKEDTNRIAWLGQSSMCIETGIPSRFRAGFKLLSADEQAAANAAARAVLDEWCER